MGNLLDEEMISVRAQGGPGRMNLPGILCRLSNGENLEFTALRPHQQHAWHAFLVQVAALTAHRSGHSQLQRRSEQEWRNALIKLGGKSGTTAWHLVVTDLRKPAFMQTPVPEGSLESARYKNIAETPDEIDTLITAKNHDVKQARMHDARLEHWVYALVSLQTMQGFLGAGNYGIARMNGGFASRPAFGASPGLGWAQRFGRDANVWLDSRLGLVKDHGYKNTGGMALLWLEPWDGSFSRSLTECDPFFIEVCRRIRLVCDQARLYACTGTTRTALLDGKQAHGNTGDIWTPVSVDGKALAVGGSGLSYRLMTEVLFRGDYRQRPALQVRQQDGEQPVVVAQVLVRGQGKTDHYRERVLPVPPVARSKLLREEGIDELRELARRRIERTNVATRKVLRPALCTLLQGGKDELDLRDTRADRWARRFDEAVDGVFFNDLWAAIDLGESEANERWDRRLVELAGEQLDDAIAVAPFSDARRPRAIARAKLIFNGASRNHLPSAYLEANEAKEETG
jgi:CRISPR system Cascade subunit CasA